MKRSHGLFAALAATLLAAWWAAGLEEGGDAPAGGRKPRDLRRAPSAPRLDAASLAAPLRASPAAGAEEAGNLFPVRSFQPPPPPPAPPEPPPRPVAPPLPYRYGGMLDDGGAPAAFVMERDQLRVVRAGDMLDGRYRVTGVSRRRIDFLYLPLNETQSLMTGALQ